ncbi:chromatin remodelling complex Rsc7/Swp82 subunit-domain-containing protein [Kockiozyma suomiensis]|uniref:chromatin remodelling complex Rsc7/Swp82 subunit-domain-containing protein n=1 Tax=Kockiozyma suomiensis TaxID=1337062 RepID=UPI003343CB17
MSDSDERPQHKRMRSSSESPALAAPIKREKEEDDEDEEKEDEAEDDYHEEDDDDDDDDDDDGDGDDDGEHEEEVKEDDDDGHGNNDKEEGEIEEGEEAPVEEKKPVVSPPAPKRRGRKPGSGAATPIAAAAAAARAKRGRTSTPVPSAKVHRGKQVKQQPQQPGSEHTTDRLNEEGDEYIVSQIDAEGEKKITEDGSLLGGRTYRMRTFRLPNHGEKYFMMATECAKELNYRDSYLLFNKNRSLYKLIATQSDKEALIEMSYLPYAYRSRQIALVTARSMFRQFGALCVVDGRRVRDDYFEQKARSEGFTEADFAIEKKIVHNTASVKDSREQESAPKPDLAPSFSEHHYLGSRADSAGQIVFGTRGAPNILDRPIEQIIRVFAKSTNAPLGPQDEPVRFNTALARGTRMDMTKRSSLHAISESAASALEFNAFLGQKRRLRNQSWHEFWLPKKAADEDAMEEVEPNTDVMDLRGEDLKTEIFNTHVY